MKTIFQVFSGLLLAPRIAVFAVVMAHVSACGFHLRGAVEVPEGVKSVYAQGFTPGSPFLSYLGQNLKHADGELIDSPKEAGLIVNAFTEQFLRREVSLSNTGKANSYELSYILTYDIRNPNGEVILPRQTITVIREYFNPQVEVIGKSAEEAVIRKALYQEAVTTLLRRVEVALHDRSVTPLKNSR